MNITITNCITQISTTDAAFHNIFYYDLLFRKKKYDQNTNNHDIDTLTKKLIKVDIEERVTNKIHHMLVERFYS